MNAPEHFEAPLDEWKLVYRVLHANLSTHLDLLDSEFLQELQSRLQAQARAEGVDTSHHAAWDAWLGNDTAATCEDRVARRWVQGDGGPRPT